jgi:ATP/maltotriose-dependent transcriptional regulator MalT
VDYAKKLLSVLAAGRPESRGLKGQQFVSAPSTPTSPVLIEPLSERELEVLRLIAVGLSNREIADEIVVATSTVKTHINNIYRKLDVSSRTQAVARARELELVA